MSTDIHFNITTQRLVDKGESETIEIRQDINHSAIARTVCAFVNGQGGTILIGLDESRSALTSQLSFEDVNHLRDYLSQHIKPTVMFSVSLDSVEQGDVVVVDVPSGLDVPYINNGLIFVRKGSQSVQADTETIRRMVLDKANEAQRWERRASLGLDGTGIEKRLVGETVRLASDNRGIAFENPRNVEANFSELGLMQTGQFTNAADVLFGKQVYLRHPQTRV